MIHDRASENLFHQLSSTGFHDPCVINAYVITVPSYAGQLSIIKVALATAVVMCRSIDIGFLGGGEGVWGGRGDTALIATSNE